MRIAFIVKSFPVITETFIQNQISGMIKRGHDVTVFALHRPDASDYSGEHETEELKNNSVYLNSIPPNRFKRALHTLSNVKFDRKELLVLLRSCNIFRYKRLSASLYLSGLALQLSKYEPFDIIHCQFGTLAPLMVKLREIGAIRGKLVTSFRGYDLTNRLKENMSAYRTLFSDGDLFLPVCKHFKSILINTGCNPEKIRVLFSGINIERLHFDPASYKENGPIRIISVGRFVEKKGFRYAIDVIAELTKREIPVTYTLYGDGKLRDELNNQIHMLKISDRVFMPGWKPHSEVIEDIRKSYILLVPSITSSDGDKEGIPNVLKEAMAVGVPVIGTDHSGIPELVIHNETGLLVQEKDPPAIADSIQTLINDPDLYDRLKQNARELVVKEYDIDILNEKLEKLYESMVTAEDMVTATGT